MPQESDIAIIAKFTQAADFPAALISGVVNAIERVVFEVEREELEYLIEAIPGIPLVAADASRQRLYVRRGQSVLVESASGGSIVIACVVSALALWILKETLGETIKEAWRDSPTHHHLKDFLSRERTLKTEQIAQRLERRMRGR